MMMSLLIKLLLFYWTLSLQFFSFIYSEEISRLHDLEWKTTKEAMDKINHVIDSSSIPLKKTHFHEKSRLFFVAGLDGAGHEKWHNILQHCIMKQKCKSASQLSHFLVRYEKLTTKGLFGASDSNHNAYYLAHEYTIMNRLNNPNYTTNSLSTDNSLIHLLGHSPTGLLTYPSSIGSRKPLDHPDLYALAAVAEAAGVDFRIIVLQRDTTDLLNSAQERHTVGSLDWKVLSLNADVLYSQLRLIDHQFFYCIKYDTNENLKNNKELLNFIHSNFTMDDWDYIFHEEESLYQHSIIGRINRNSYPGHINIQQQRHKQNPFQSELLEESSKLQTLEGSDELDILNEQYHIQHLNVRLQQIDRICDSLKY